MSNAGHVASTPSAADSQFLRVGARHLDTPYWLLGRKSLLDAISERAMASVTGASGTGKSYLLNTIEPEIDIPVCRYEPGLRPTMFRVTADLVRLLTGELPRGRKDDLVPYLIAALRGPLALIVDEAQRLNAECLDHFRFAHDHRATNFALLLAGGERCWEVLGTEPQLRRRIWRRSFFRPLTPEQVGTFIPGFHPVWSGVEQSVIARIDDEFAQGLLGNWAAITKTVERLVHEEIGRDDLIPTAMYLHGITS